MNGGAPSRRLNIAVIGSGRWGGFLAWYLDGLGHKVTLFGRASSTHFENLMQTRTNGIVSFSPTISFDTDLSHAAKQDMIVIAISAQGLPALADELSRFDLVGKTIILCMKGLEAESGRRLSDIVKDALPAVHVAVWVGPGHVQDFLLGIPNCMVIDSADPATTARVTDTLSGGLIRFYYGRDLIGNEIGAAAKNVIGIAAGLLDGLNRSALKGALMSRGTLEIARLIQALGGQGHTAYGLAHLGDYEATLFSPHSHNRAFGEAFARGLPYDSLAEGVATSKALYVLSQKLNVDMPISRAVYDVIHRGMPAMASLDELFLRSQKPER